MKTILQCAALLSSAALCLGVQASAWAQEAVAWQDDWECGPAVAPNRVAPMDYRTNRKMLPLVERFHFQPHVESLVRPMFQHFGADLDYTLHAFPNHHRALITLVKLGEREGTDQPKGAQYSIDCFFRRAIRFRGDDLVVRMIYAQYLGRKKRLDDADRQLNFARDAAGENALTHYNIGLVYAELHLFGKAREQAQRAAALGLQRSELREILTRAGHWEATSLDAGDPQAAASSSNAASR